MSLIDNLAIKDSSEFEAPERPVWDQESNRIYWSSSANSFEYSANSNRILIDPAFIMSTETETQQTSFSNSNKKTDETSVSTPPSGGFLWRMSSGIYSTATGAVTGAVGYGVTGVKWVAEKTVDVGSTVAHKTMDAGSAVASKLPIPSVSVPFVSKKDKKE